MRSMFSRKIVTRVLFNTLLGVGLIWVWSRFVSLEEIRDHLREVEPTNILYMFLLFIVASFLRSFRLKVLLSNYSTSLKDLTLLNFLSQFLSFMIPIRAGEITKGVYLSSQLGTQFSKTLVWVFIDRLVDFWMVFLMILLSLLFIPSLLPERIVYGSISLLVLVSILMIILVKNQQLGKKLINLVSNIFILSSIKKRFVSFSNSILEGFDILDSGSVNLLIIFLVTFIAFVLDGVFWWLMFYSIGVDIGVIKGILGNLLMALTFLLPAAPGYVGSAEASGLAVWSGLLGLSSGVSSAATVLFHLVSVVILLVLGLTGFYLLKFDLNLVWRRFKNSSN